MLQDTFAWMQENQQVRDAVLGGARVEGKALPDAVVTDPAMLLELAKAVAIEACGATRPRAWSSTS
jgi:hypothetical protein